MEMAAYVIVNLDVRDAGRFEEYRARVPAVIGPHGGRYPVRGGGLHPVEGDLGPKRLVVLESPSAEAARRFRDSPEHAPLPKLRRESTESDTVPVEGRSPPA
jgi:uncharacterized protein (DUF1330 family)